jgi:hypothetical protein
MKSTLSNISKTIIPFETPFKQTSEIYTHLSRERLKFIRKEFGMILGTFTQFGGDELRLIY